MTLNSIGQCKDRNVTASQERLVTRPLNRPATGTLKQKVIVFVFLFV